MTTTPLPGPHIIAGFGGSGTRVVAGIVRQAGMHIGTNLNGPLDALDFADYCTRRVRTFMRDPWPPSPAALADMTHDLEDVVERHRASIDGAERAWGWKNSGSLYFLPFFQRRFPQLRFLHVVRDGRDMAYSANQYQLRRHGDLLLTPEEKRWSQPLRSMALWSRVNLLAADYAETHLRDRYLLVRFEDVCASPIPAVQRILDFCGLTADAARIAHDQIVPAESIGRWQNQPSTALTALRDVGRVALRRFGYGDGDGTVQAGRTVRERVMGLDQAVRSRLSAGPGGHAAEMYRRLRHEIRNRVRHQR